MIGTTILYITFRLVYDTLLVILGPTGFLFNYADDVYMGGAPMCVALSPVAAPDLYAMVGM